MLRGDGCRNVLLGLAAILSAAFPLANAAAASPDRQAFKRPLDIPFPAGAPYSPQLATLGKMLFFDSRLSGAKNLNCASCHNPSFGYEVPVETAIGAANEPLGRQAPTILNAAWISPLFWDGRAPDLEEQAAGPITAPVEMNGRFEDIVEELGAVETYRTWFARLFPDSGINRANILTAIATYERTVVSGWAPFDRWVDGDETAISESARRGFALFTGKAGCATCHSGWNFTDNAFHDIGMPGEDIGRAALEPDNPKARYAFKTPGLRNLSYRAPFMHDGSIPDLEGVVSFYETGGVERPSRSAKIRPFTLNDSERADLVAFMRSLTSEKTDIKMPVLPN